MIPDPNAPVLPLATKQRIQLAGQKFATRAGLAYAGWVGQKWLATDQTISGLWHAIETYTDRAAGAGLIAGLAAFGYSFGVKTRVPKTGAP